MLRSGRYRKNLYELYEPRLFIQQVAYFLEAPENQAEDRQAALGDAVKVATPMRRVGPVQVKRADRTVQRFAVQRWSGAQLQQQVPACDQVLDAVAVFVLGNEMVQQCLGQAAQALRSAMDMLGVEARYARVERLQRLHQLDPALRLAQKTLEPVLLRSKQSQ